MTIHQLMFKPDTNTIHSLQMLGSLVIMSAAWKTMLIMLPMTHVTTQKIIHLLTGSMVNSGLMLVVVRDGECEGVLTRALLYNLYN